MGLWRIAPPFPRRDPAEAPGAYAGRLIAWLTATRPLRAIQHLTDSGGPVLAAGLGYMALFSLFAILWVAFSVLGIILTGNEKLLSTLIERAGSSVPGLLGEGGMIDPESAFSAAAFGWTGVIAFAGAIWTATGWMDGARIAIRTVFSVPVQTGRSLLRAKLRDLALIGVLGLFAILSAALSLLPGIIAATTLGAIGLGNQGALITGIARAGGFLISFGVDFTVIATILRILASLRIPRPALLQGAALGALLTGLLKQLGSVLLGGASSNPLLASFAVILGVLIFFQLNCTVLLLSASWVKNTMDDIGAAPRLLTAEQAGEEAALAELHARRDRLSAEVIRLRERINETSRFARGRRRLMRDLAATENERALIEHAERRRRLNLDRIEGND